MFQNLKNSNLTAAIVALLATTGATQAATITTASAVNFDPAGIDPITGDIDPAAVNEEDFDQNVDSSSTASVDGASAFQDVDGSSSVSAVVNEPFAGGRVATAAIAELVLEDTNSTGELQGYEFSFSLFDLAVQVQENYGSSFFSNYNNPFEDLDSDAVGNAIFYDVFVNDVEVFSASIALYGGIDDGFTIENDGFSFTQSDILDPFDGTVAGSRLDIADVTETLFLGNFADGESVQVTTTLGALSLATNFEGEQAAGGFFGDPSGLSSSGGTLVQVAPQVAAVPLPAAGWMLIAGVGGLVAAGRRNRG